MTTHLVFYCGDDAVISETELGQRLAEELGIPNNHRICRGDVACDDRDGPDHAPNRKSLNTACLRAHRLLCCPDT